MTADAPDEEKRQQPLVFAGRRRSDRIKRALIAAAMFVLSAISAGLTSAIWDGALAAERSWWASYAAGIDRCPHPK